MEEFKDLENLWKQSETKVLEKKPDVLKIKNNRNKMKNTHIKGGILLVITGIFLLFFINILDEKLQTNLIVGSIIVISLMCFAQALLMFFNANQIAKIDDTQEPKIHLKQWQDFRNFQKKQRQWNMKVYYVVLSVSLGVYMYELLKTVDLWKMILAFIVTYSWMFFAYFYLGKKEIKKQDAKLDGIISELRNLENQFQ